jgi:hypothetical protein
MSKPLPPLNSIRAFEVAARHTSFSRAAEEIGVTPGAISKQILALEVIRQVAGRPHANAGGIFRQVLRRTRFRTPFTGVFTLFQTITAIKYLPHFDDGVIRRAIPCTAT